MNRRKRLDIQALRAVAVLAVVIYHIWPDRLIGGFMGVDIFFVISGYLMTTSLMRDIKPVLVAKKKIQATGSFLSNFYARRIKRLIPAAAVTLLATLGLVAATGNLALIQQNANQVFTSAIFVQNWQLANESVDYLADKNPSAVQHFWSLSLEEQFYLAWPIILLAIILFTTNMFIVYKKHKSINLAIIPVVLLAAGFFIYGYYLTKTNPSLAYFITPARVWELLLGAIIAFLPNLKNYDLRLLLPWAGTVMIGYSLFQWNGEGFPGWHALVPTLGTAMIIYAGSVANESKWSFEYMFRFKPIQWIGDLSYSLYLWHWPLIVLLPVLLFIDLDKHPRASLLKLGILLLSIVMAHLSYRYVEQSTQHLKVQKRYVYITFIVVTSLVAGLGYFMSSRAESSLNTSISEVRTKVVGNTDECIGALSIENHCDKSLGYISPEYSQIGPSDKYDSVLLDKGKPCASYDGQWRAHLENVCEVGDLSSTREITFWGDSHTQHWINPADKIGKENGIKITVVGASNCYGSTKYEVNCSDRFKYLQSSGVLDRSESIIVSTWYTGLSDSTAPDAKATDALEMLMRYTDNRDIYFLEDIPASGAGGGPGCSLLRLSCKNSLEQATGDITKNSSLIVSIGLLKQDQIITVKDMFCDDNYCYSNIGGLPVYRDKNISESNNSVINSHMTASYAYSTWSLLENKLIESGALKQAR